MDKKIAFIIPTLSNGGAERVVSNLTKAIPEEYDKVTIVYHGTEKSYDHDGEVINIDIGPAKGIAGKLLNIYRRVKLIKQIKQERKIDKSISFLDNPNIINVLSRINEDVYVSIRNQQSKEFTGLKKVFHKLAVQAIYSRAKKIVAISNGVKNDLVDNFGISSEKITVIYNPVDIDKINELKCEPIDSSYESIFTKPTIITVGRLSDQKGQWHLVRAFQKVVEKIPDAQLIILGTGSLEDYLKSLTSNLKLEKNIHFLGFQDNPFKYIERSDIFVLPSLFEGLGNVILEAMACGTPVISTDCKSGPRELIAPVTNLDTSINNASIEDFGILIPVPGGQKYEAKDPLSHEEKIIAQSILLLLEDAVLAEKMKQKGFQRVKDFSFGHIADEWLKL